MRLTTVRRTAITWGTVISLVAVGTTAATFQASAQEGDETPDEIDHPLVERAEEEGSIPLVVELHTVDHGPGVASNARRSGGESAESLSHLPYVLTDGDADTVVALLRDPRVRRVHEDVAVAADLDASLAVIGADTVQTLGWTGAGTTVAILDTGIDADHPFFMDNNGGNPTTSRIVAQACFSTNNGGAGTSLCDNGMASDLTSADIDAHPQCTAQVNFCDHGTHVAGIAAGDGAGLAGATSPPAAGVAPDADIIAVNVFTRFDDDDDCGGNTGDAPCIRSFAGDMIRGLNYVYDLADDNPGWNITSANLSIGGTMGCVGDAQRNAVANLLNDFGIVTVTSYGNEGNIIVPGCANLAVTVGSTTNDDVVLRNRGPALEMFAPGGDFAVGPVGDGVRIRSAIINVFGLKQGTSMAAPHVAGAFAVLREAYPGRTIGQLRNDMTSTGVPITYPIGGGNTTTTPRLDLLTALQAPNSPPTVTVGNDPVIVDEGDLATNTGTYNDPDGDPLSSITATVGTVVDNGDGTWSWQFQAVDGPADSQTVTITATDDKGEAGSASFGLVVNNVAPSVSIDPAQVTVIDEGDTVQVTATFADPGILDAPFDATVTWGVPPGEDGIEVSPPSVQITNPGGPDTPLEGTVTASYTYGDNDDGTGFEVTVAVTDKDGASGSDSFTLSVANVDPVPVIDTGGLPIVGGVPTVVASAGDPVMIESHTTDPGSDDLLLEWDMGDSNTYSRLSLVNPPNPDPLPSPTVQPRSEPDDVTHAFADACLYETVFMATDDDSGTADDTVTVLIVGNDDQARSAGYWQTEYGNAKKRHLDDETLECYLLIVDHISEIFSEERPLGTYADAAAILHPGGSGGNPRVQLDRQILAAWLNFANGAYGLDELVDSAGNGVPDTAFWEVMQTAESVRLDPSSTRQELVTQKDIVESLNT